MIFATSNLPARRLAALGARCGFIHGLIGDGRQQPVFFVPGEELRLTDSDGKALLVRIVEIVGRSALVEYRDPEPRE